MVLFSPCAECSLNQCDPSADPYDWIIVSIFLSSVNETRVDLRRCRFRLLDLDDSIWLRNALWRLNFPEAVRLNRFFAPEFDFILGMIWFLL
jgi:hypothetical protein